MGASPSPASPASVFFFFYLMQQQLKRQVDKCPTVRQRDDFISGVSGSNSIGRQTTDDRRQTENSRFKIFLFVKNKKK